MKVWLVMGALELGSLSAFNFGAMATKPTGLVVALGSALGLALLLGGANLMRDLIGAPRWHAARARVWNSLMLAEAALCVMLLLVATVWAWMLLAAPLPPAGSPALHPSRHAAQPPPRH